MLSNNFRISRVYLLHHNVLSISICLRSPVSSTEPTTGVRIDRSPWVFGVLIILKVLIWILIVDFLWHLIWWLLKLLRVDLLYRLPILLPHVLILLEHLVIALDLLLVRNDVLLGCSRAGVVCRYMALILVILMRTHI